MPHDRDEPLRAPREPDPPTLDARRRRLRFRSWHRGTREMDLLLGSFADAHLASFSAGQLDRYEALLGCNDPDLYDWIAGRAAVPEDCRSDVLDLLLAHDYARRAR